MCDQCVTNVAARWRDFHTITYLAHHGRHVGLVRFEAFADVARFEAHLEGVRVAHHHEVGEILVGELLGDEDAREGLVKSRHSWAGASTIEHAHTVAVCDLMHALALLEVLVEAR